MNDYRKPVHREDPAPYEPIKVNPIESDKKRKEQEDPHDAKTATKPLGFAILASLIKQFINLFANTQSFTFDSQQMLEDATSFKKLLDVLTQEDQSHNPEFVEHLSELWHNLQADCDTLRFYRHQAPTELIELKKILDEIDHYPPHSDHTLGYYFRESAGKEWIPFPFMEMLQSLHQEAIKKPSEATLTRWIHSLSLLSS